MNEIASDELNQHVPRRVVAGCRRSTWLGDSINKLWRQKARQPNTSLPNLKPESHFKECVFCFYYYTFGHQSGAMKERVIGHLTYALVCRLLTVIN